METAAHPRSLFKPRTFGMMILTLTSSASLWSGVVKTFRCLSLAYRMRTQFRVFDAHCESCGHRFLRPGLGDMTYGEFIFATATPPNYVYCNAFAAGPQLIHDLLDDSTADCFQAALARFADGCVTANSLKCPSCGQSSLSIAVDGTGHPIDIPSTTYSRILSLPRDVLAAELAKFKAEWQG